MFLRIMRTRRHRSVGTLNKVHGAEDDRSQLVLKKKCAHKHIRASCSPAVKLSQKVVNEAIAENPRACHQDEK